MNTLLYRVQVDDAIRLDCHGPEGLGLKPNDLCIIGCSRYTDLGRVTFVGPLPPSGPEAPRDEAPPGGEPGPSASAPVPDHHAPPPSHGPHEPTGFHEHPEHHEHHEHRLTHDEIPEVRRRASLVDQGKAHENEARAKSYHRTCDDLIHQHQLPMNLVSTHVTWDRSLVIFVFTAPGRVDFRGLLRDLNTALKMRVELRQIGPRDEAAIIGGLGSCGRCLCCAQFLVSFVSINVRMAKLQGVSLNPSSIIGACGRLKCCLAFEYDTYRELAAALPRLGGRCVCDGCQGRVVDCNPLTQEVKLLMDDERLLTLPASQLQAPPAEEG